MRAVLALAVLVLPLVAGDHAPQGECDSDGQMALGIVEITGGSADTTWYVDDRNALANGVWLYQESNGRWTGRDPAHDLQRGSYVCMYCETTEVCVDDPLWYPDLLVL